MNTPIKSRPFSLPLASLVICMAASYANADLIVEFGNVSLQPGSSGSIDVFVRSSDGSDQIAQYNALFRITPVSGQGILEFNPTDRQDNTEISNSNYVFFGDSNDFQAKREDNKRGDMTQNDFAATIVPLNSRRLLGQLELNQILPASEIATFTGAEYQVSLIKSPGLTYFATDDYSTLVPIQEASYSNFGTVTVVGVPEPSSSLLLLCAFGTSVFRRRRSCAPGVGS